MCRSVVSHFAQRSSRTSPSDHDCGNSPIASSLRTVPTADAQLAPAAASPSFSSLLANRSHGACQARHYARRASSNGVAPSQAAAGVPTPARGYLEHHPLCPLACLQVNLASPRASPRTESPYREARRNGLILNSGGPIRLSLPPTDRRTSPPSSVS